MKTSLIAFLLIGLWTSVFSQTQDFEVRGMYARPVKRDQLNTAQEMGDFCKGYPKSWISSYVSTEISAVSGGKVLKAMGINDTLNENQKQILKSADLNSDITVNILFPFENPVTHAISTKSMHFSLTVIPEKEAEYPEGYPKLKAYLADNGVHKIKPKDSTKFQQVKVRFTINEKGAITQACISESSKDASTDTLLLQTIQKMPKWSPAENAKGERVKQEFELVVGNAGC